MVSNSTDCGSQNEVATNTRAETIFGTLGEIAPMNASIAIIIICAFVVFFKYVFKLLRSLTFDSIFLQLVIAIEHELMLVSSSYADYDGNDC